MEQQSKAQPSKAQQLALTATVPESKLGQRLDQVLSDLFPDYSRSRIKTWILDHHVQVDGEFVDKPREKLLGGEQVIIHKAIEKEVLSSAEDITLDVVYEDEDLLVINKPRHLVVHPGAGNPNGTLLNALLYHYPSIANVPRAGIVHRLDKETTGLMVVAKTLPAQTHLVTALQQREITREYEAVVIGSMTGGGTIDEPLARHPKKRTLRTVHPSGKPAVTHYRVVSHFRGHTHLCLRLETGRTHQIRAHMAHIHHPLVGDTAYGWRPHPPKNASEQCGTVIRQFNRQALHACMLRLRHPIKNTEMMWRVPLPEDMKSLISALKTDAEAFNYDLEAL